MKDPQVGDDGKIVLDGNGDPVLDFYRAIKVNFGTTNTSEGTVWTTALAGSPTGGTYTLLVDGDETADIAFDATNATIKAALVALDGVDGVGIAGTTTKTITFQKAVVLTADDALTGGTTPSVTVTKVS